MKPKTRLNMYFVGSIMAELTYVYGAVNHWSIWILVGIMVPFAFMASAVFRAAFDQEAHDAK